MSVDNHHKLILKPIPPNLENMLGNQRIKSGDGLAAAFLSQIRCRNQSLGNFVPQNQTLCTEKLNSSNFFLSDQSCLRALKQSTMSDSQFRNHQEYQTRHYDFVDDEIRLIDGSQITDSKRIETSRRSDLNWIDLNRIVTLHVVVESVDSDPNETLFIWEPNIFS